MNKTISLVVGTLLLVVLMSGIVLSVEEAVEKEQSVMIVGIIGDANQLVDTNGKIFDVADTQEGKEMLTHVGKKVQVKGTLTERGGKKLISISSYEILKK